jgi:hypothetical protein
MPVGASCGEACAVRSAGRSFQTACITIDQAMFEPTHWIDQLIRHSLPPRYQKGTSVTAVGQQEIEELLHAALSDCVDFVFVPVPKTFVIYADHDEYTTFYANTRSNLNRVAEPLLTNGFEEVSGYQRRLWRGVLGIAVVISPHSLTRS